MKKIVAIIILLFTIILFGYNQVYAAENIIDEKNESQLIKIKENAAKTLDEYKEKYGSDAYGLTAYILNMIMVNNNIIIATIFFILFPFPFTYSIYLLPIYHTLEFKK